MTMQETQRPQIVPDEDETDSNPNDSPLRKRLRRFFHSNLFNYTLAALIVCDLCIVLTDIIFLLVYCDDIPHHIEVVIEDLPIVSIVILGCFLMELALQMYAFGPRQWLSECLHTFDLVVTLLTFVMEIVFHGNEKVESVVGLLIVFRLWRLVRVIHVTTEALELKHETEQHAHEKNDEDLAKRFEDLQAENQKLKEELQKFQITHS
mmetsp:Transcript_6463/g.10211  ORF Transcript_6463/g.10211 Transcript_6463/m.10211 type:complete len:207 (-) Transcript_6463:99-719(-)|eukprot:CAMPEP_0202708664 /NCGR_PEP_ID=MMETSP1385-20130828/20825_1 /ASSEMBLY_ACC=CAM_ASM_000861 /TAXON_ID=933848 /ORGANISM="Elphidium margaritaceum" /LENGTH=206 /DNA_ID=CAMNT_0049367701 /DNA_START=32 /DNA_END=652 /DNA_ORIENTATION=-